MSSSVLRALRSAFLVQRSGTGDPTTGYAEHPKMLARNAVVARRFFDEPLLGELRAGAPADLCVVDCPPPTPVSSENVFTHLVFGAAESPVRHTVARGTVLLENFRHTMIDVAALANEARSLAPQVWERFRALEEPTRLEPPPGDHDSI
jgi:cytosine/adenosine deaminase-related metal-dependent hydrolase